MGIGRKVQLPARDARLKLGSPITPVAEPLQNHIEICQEKHVRAAIRRDLLSQAEIPRPTPKITFLKKLQCQPVPVKDIRAWREIFHCMHNKIEIIERCSLRIEEIGWDPTRCPVKHGGELFKADRFAGEFAGGATPLDDLLDSIPKNLIVAAWPKGKEPLF